MNNNTKDFLLKFGFKCNKNLDQFFLINTQIIEQIFQYVNIQKNSLVLEIGSGSGNLTEKLITISNNVISLEVDTRLKKILENRFQNHKNVKFIFESFLNHKQTVYDYIIGNLPFSLTKEIFFKLIRMDFKEGIFMISSNFKDIFIKDNFDKHYTLTRIIVRLFFEIDLLIENISPESFYPKADVSAAVIKIKFKNTESFEEIFSKKFFLNPHTTLSWLCNNYGFKIQIPDKIKTKKIKNISLKEMIDIEPLAKVIFQYL